MILIIVIKWEGSIISKKYKGMFDNFRERWDNCNNNYFNKWRKWPIFLWLSPFKLCALAGVLITLLFSGVGLYGIIILILLILLFIFLP